MSSQSMLSLFDSIPAWVMFVPIAICSVLLVAIAIERLIFISANTRALSSKIDSFFILFSSGRIDEAAAFGRSSANIILETMADFLTIPDGHDRESYMQFLAEKCQRRIERFSGSLSTIATVAPMFGLFGTVTGMMSSFSGLAKSGTPGQELLAMGIAVALLTTAFGLLVAIPALILYNYLVSRSSLLIKELEISANRILAAIDGKN